VPYHLFTSWEKGVNRKKAFFAPLIPFPVHLSAVRSFWQLIINSGLFSFEQIVARTAALTLLCPSC